MKNDVLGFSHQAPVSIAIESWMRVCTVDASEHASVAARLCAIRDYNVLVVRSGHANVGLFLPEYLREVLPDTHLAKDLLQPIALVTRDLGAWIDVIDDAGILFHAETVNLGLRLRKCPQGHVTSANPCQTHHIATTQFP